MSVSAASMPAVVAAHDADRAGGLLERLGQLAHVLAGDAEQRLGLDQAVAPADPQLAHAVQPELTVLAVGAGQPVDRRVVAVAALAGLQDEDAVVGLVPGEVDVLGRGAEVVLGVVGAGLQIARGDHQALAGEARGQRGAAAGGVRGLRDRLQVAQLGVGPAALHVLRELVRDARVKAVLALLDRLLVLVRGLRRELVGHYASF